MFFEGEAEKEDGNIEFKYKLNNSTPERIEELTSQLRYRMNEGNNECIYRIGIHDDGRVEGLTDEEYEETLRIMNIICKKNNYVISSIYKYSCSSFKNVYEILIREYDNSKYTEIKVAIAGNVNASKSSLLGVLTTGKLDDGRGLSRTSIFNYYHEIKTGMTSSVAHHILGYNIYGEIVNYKDGRMSSWTDIVKNSYKIISFSDLAGHEKYLKTTITGLSSTFPDICLILVESISDKITRMTKEHIFLCISLNIPFVIIITKMDLIEKRENIYKNTMDELLKILKIPGISKIPFKIKDESDVRLCAENIYKSNMTPIFSISNITGQGLNQLKQFFNLIGKKDKKYNKNDPVEFHIDSIFNVKGIGTVVGGNLINGSINVYDKLYLGPDTLGKYTIVNIKSIHVKRTPVESVSHSTYVCLNIKGIKQDLDKIRRGQVILGNKFFENEHSKETNVKEFIADMRILKSHSTTIKSGYEPTIYTYSVRQTAKLLEIINKSCDSSAHELNDKLLKIGDKATVKFSLKYRPEFLKKGSTIFFNEGRTKAVGIITDIL
jgi:elongation factor 1-alpha